MYYAAVILLLFVFPLASAIAEAMLSHHAVTVLPLVGRWFVFWPVGVRLFIAGVRQVLQPKFTAQEIFRIQDRASFSIVRELGFANLSMGLLGICSVFRSDWILPAAIVGGLYYGLAGTGHTFQKDKNTKETLAMVSDIFLFGVLLVFVLNNFLQ